MILVTIATFLRVDSTDFLEPKSPHAPPIPASHAQSHHFGLIIRTDPTKRIPDIISAIIRSVLIG
jgi:hypothetical protein